MYVQAKIEIYRANATHEHIQPTNQEKSSTRYTQRTSSHRRVFISWCCSKEFLVGVERKSKKVVYVENKSAIGSEEEKNPSILFLVC